jgi:hypothetical protein
MSTTTKKRQSAYKAVPVKGTADSFLDDGYSDLETLGEEMRERSDNMEGANMGHLPACEQATEAADVLEQIVANRVDLPEAVQDLEVSTNDWVNRRRGRGESRAHRRDNAAGRLSAVTQALREWLDDEKNEEHDDREEVETAADQLEEQAGEAEGVEFPGMYG